MVELRIWSVQQGHKRRDSTGTMGKNRDSDMGAKKFMLGKGVSLSSV